MLVLSGRRNSWLQRGKNAFMCVFLGRWVLERADPSHPRPRMGADPAS
jgi:hypothetical protein